MAAIFCLAGSHAAAQSAFRAPAIEVFAERAPLVDTTGSQAVTVIDRARIEARAPASVAELLVDVAGVHVDRLGNAGGGANLYLRGADPNHTVVMVDGVRLNDPTDARGGGFDLSEISVGEVERIEVLRGAGSAQFGADAMGGVVNIVTRASGGGAPRAAAFVQAGGQDLREARAEASAGAFNAGAGRLRGGREADGGRVERDHARASLAYDAPDGSRWRVHARSVETEARAFPESSGGVALAVDRRLEARAGRDQLGSIAYDTGWRAAWRAGALVSTTHSEEDRDAPAILPGPGGFVPATTSSTAFDRHTVAAQLTRRGLPWQAAITLGGEVLREDGRRDSRLAIAPGGVPSAFHLVRDLRGAFVQADAMPVDALRLIAAVRRDDVDPGTGRTSRSAGVRWSFAPRQSLRAHWSEGFKPPSFFALGDALVGNPELAPETSRSREAGWDGELGAAKASATLFDTRFESLVDFDPATFHMVNRDGARLRGAELQASLATAWQTRFDAAYTYLDASLDEPGAVLRNRPRHRASLSAEHAFGRWLARVGATYVGATHDFSVPTGDVRLGAFTVADARLTWRERRWRVTVAVDNLTDRAYASFVGFTAPGRRVRVSLALEP